jgi:hypothetical protein
MKNPKERGMEKRQKKNFVTEMRSLWKKDRKVALQYLRQKCTSPLSTSMTTYFSDSDSDGGEDSDDETVNSITEMTTEPVEMTTSPPIEESIVDTEDQYSSGDIEYVFISGSEEELTNGEHWVIVREGDCN